MIKKIFFICVFFSFVFCINLCAQNLYWIEKQQGGYESVKFELDSTGRYNLENHNIFKIYSISKISETTFNIKSVTDKNKNDSWICFIKLSSETSNYFQNWYKLTLFDGIYEKDVGKTFYLHDGSKDWIEFIVPESETKGIQKTFFYNQKKRENIKPSS